MKRKLLLTGVCAVLVCVWSSPARATWSHDPEENHLVCGREFNQYRPSIVGDGSSGVIVTWEESIGGDLYAQRIDASGTLVWGAGGTELSDTGSSHHPQLVADGAGGAILTWADWPSSTVHAQHLDALGNPLWAPGGVVASGFAGHAWIPTPASTSDGDGGAIIVWVDGYDEIDPNQGVRAQRVDASGSVLWGADGVVLGQGFSWVPWNATLTSDGAGGITAAWYAREDNHETDVLAQRVNSSGEVVWAAGGLEICSATGSQFDQRLVCDGTGGAIIVWTDTRHDPGARDIYAQRVDASGDVLWAVDGVPVCAVANRQSDPQVLADGVGGAIIVWFDERSDDGDVFAQRVDASGTMLWDAGGVEICGAVERQSGASLISDGAGGAIISWKDSRDTHDYYNSCEVYAQRVDASGSRLWEADGVEICGAAGSKDGPVLAGDGAGGAVMAWGDGRGDGWWDIYAQRIERNGHLGYPAPEPTEIVDYPDDQGGVAVLSWLPSYLDAYPNEIVTHYSVWMRMPEDRVLELRDRPSMQHLADEVGMSVESVQGLIRSGWALVGETPACYWDEYAYHAPTYGDSTEAGVPLTEYMVVAHASDQWAFWESVPRAGYSVDNIAPGAPVGLGTEPLGTGVALAWSPSNDHDEDLSVYRVYRSDMSAFTPDEAVLVGAAADTFFTDADPGIGTWYYVVAARDIHGNEGEPSNEASARVDDPAVPLVYALRGNYPNPFNPVTAVAYDVPEPGGKVTLEVFDVTGRLVRTLVDGYETAGRKQAFWDGTDERGRSVASGVYYCRMTAPGYEKSIKMTLLK